MTAPAARTLAEIVAEANRRHAEIESATMGTTRSMLTAELARFYAEHGPLLLAVAEAAVRYTDALDDYDHTDDGDFVHQRALLTQTKAALCAAVRGEEPK